MAAVDLAPNASLQAETVKSLGCLAYYNHAWSDKWSSAFGFSQHKQTNTDGQLVQRVQARQLRLDQRALHARRRT